MPNTTRPIVEIIAGGTRGPQGNQGNQGIQGIQGVPGNGVTVGGTTGQFLGKASNSDYDTQWFTLDQSMIEGLTISDSPAFTGLNISGTASIDGVIHTTGGGGIRSSGDLYLDTATTGSIYFRPAVFPVVQIHTSGDTDFIWGNVEIIAVGQGLIMKSPNGNRWKLGVSNAGATVWTAL